MSMQKGENPQMVMGFLSGQWTSPPLSPHIFYILIFFYKDLQFQGKFVYIYI
jgi:hypothetical protein